MRFRLEVREGGEMIIRGNKDGVISGVPQTRRSKDSAGNRKSSQCRRRMRSQGLAVLAVEDRRWSIAPRPESSFFIITFSQLVIHQNVSSGWTRRTPQENDKDCQFLVGAARLRSVSRTSGLERVRTLRLSGNDQENDGSGDNQT